MDDGPGVADGEVEGTRERILAEAIDMFIRHGYHRTSLRVLADRLGITKAAILYHFPAKDRILVALMEPFVGAIEAAVERAAAVPYPQRRRVLLDGVLDSYFEHQKLLVMARVDAAIFSQEETYQRFMRLPQRVIEIIVGPDAPLADKVWAVQLMGTLGDAVLFFGDAPQSELRAAIMHGASNLLAAGRPSRTPDPTAGADRADRPPPTPASGPSEEQPGNGRRIGRPRALSGERITRAREMHAGGTHTVDDIAAELGVSRATVYRYLN